MSTINITRPTADQALIISHFFSNLLPKSFTVFTPEALTIYLQSWTIERLTTRLANRQELLLVAWQDQEPIGLIAGAQPEGGVGTIIWLVVKENCRGKQIGKSLLLAARQHYAALNCHKIKLTAPNELARNFYVKCGMEIEGFHKKHWYGVDFWALGQML